LRGSKTRYRFVPSSPFSLILLLSFSFFGFAFRFFLGVRFCPAFFLSLLCSLLLDSAKRPA
jgi:hypothetical protein